MYKTSRKYKKRRATLKHKRRNTRTRTRFFGRGGSGSGVQNDWNRFIHFGCWNDRLIGHSSESIPMTDIDNENKINLVKVSKLLKQKIDENQETQQPFQFVIVAGDNYYNKEGKEKKDKKDKGEKGEKKEKKEKKKIFDVNKLKYGFRLITKNTSELPIYMLWGNHEFDKTIIPEDVEPIASCNIIENQLRLIGASGDKIHIDYAIDVKEPIQHLLIDHGKTLIVMVDSTMFEDKYEKYLDCYKTLYPSSDATIEYIIGIQNQRLALLIQQLKNTGQIQNIQNVIVEAHHPLCIYKNNKEESCNVFEYNEKLLDFVLHNVIDGFSDPKINYFHLCADLHLFQTGTITVDLAGVQPYEITQYISGTGGAKFDFMNKDDFYCEKTDGIKYNITEPSRVENGFLDCSSVNGVFTAQFISVHEINP
jgi:hypothetical protein